MINSNQAKKYCSEPLENIEGYAEAVADQTQTWEIHHRLEINNFNHNRSDGGIVSRKQLIEDGIYYGRPARELVFVTKAEHKRIHRTDKKRINMKNVSLIFVSDVEGNNLKTFASLSRAAEYIGCTYKHVWELAKQGGMHVVKGRFFVWFEDCKGDFMSWKKNRAAFESANPALFKGAKTIETVEDDEEVR